MLIRQEITLMRHHERRLAILAIGQHHSIVLVEKKVKELRDMIEVNHAFVKADAALALGHDSQDISDLIEAELFIQADIHIEQSFYNIDDSLLFLLDCFRLVSRLLVLSILRFRILRRLLLRWIARLLNLDRNMYLELIGALQLV